MEKKYMGNGVPADKVQVTDPLDLVQTKTETATATATATQTPASYATDSSNLNLNLSAEEQSLMMKNIAEIFALEEEEDVEMEDDEEQVVDVEDQERRTAKLKGVLPTLAQLWWSDSEHMSMAAEKLADGSRDRE